MTKRSPPAHKNAPKTDKTVLATAVEATKTDMSGSTMQRTKRPRSQSSDIHEDLNTFKDELLTSIKSMMANHSVRLDKLEDRLISIHDQNKNIQSTNKEIEKAMNNLSDDIKNIESQLSALEQEKQNFIMNFAYYSLTSIHSTACFPEIPHRFSKATFS